MAPFDVTHGHGFAAGSPVYGSNLEAECRAAGVDPAGVVDFSSNSNMLGPPHCIEQVLHDGIALASTYPDPHYTQAKAALAGAHGVEPATILLGNGATELLYLVARILHPDKTLILAPSYPDFVRAAMLAGSQVELRVAPASRLFRHDLLSMRDVSDFHLVLLANPNNPTGTLLRSLEVMEWAAENPGTFFLVDESYIDFVGSQKASLIGIKCRNLIIVKSLTSFFAVPGLRLGMLHADPEVVRLIAERQEPYSVNTLSQKIATMLYDEAGYISATNQVMKQERSYLIRGLTEQGFRVFDSPANFLMLRIENRNWKSPELKKQLLVNHGLLIYDCSDMHGLDEKYVRVTIRRHDENERLLAAIQDLGISD